MQPLIRRALDVNDHGLCRVLELPGVSVPIGVTLFKERIASFFCLVGHVCKTCCFTRKYLLSNQPIVNQVERELEHALCGGAFLIDFFCPLQSGRLQFGMRK